MRAICEHGLIRFAAASEADAAPEPVAAADPRAAAGSGAGRSAPSSARRRWSPAGPDLATLDAGGAAAASSWSAPGARATACGRWAWSGTKTLQDLFTDRGVPRSLRHRLPVVTAAGRVAWVAGVAVSEDFRLGPEARAAAVARRPALLD